MAYIRKNTSELTGYQEGGPLRPSIDLGCDFVMVYGLNDTTKERIRQYRDAGYVVHLMTGIAWGQYQDYLDGQWDGLKHWDEGQKARNGKDIIHGPTVPYMVPTVAFSDYLSEKLKAAVDAGVEAIHMEEPEFWDYGGYSEAFKREYEIRYREPFVPQHVSVDAHYRTAQLKAELYARALSRVSQVVKEYAKARYGRDLRFYVPTHSLINYTTWKIMSPEAALIGLDTVDGYIAQIWTGTSREANVYEGVYRERTFETAFLEYGVMQELTRGTGRRMWFLNDPIEDLPSYTWDNYRYNYCKTAVASLLNPGVWHYEICPWPRRVFEGEYPRYQPRIAEKDETSFKTEASRPIPDSYRTFLSSMFQLFGDMDRTDWAFEGLRESVGVFMSDTGLFQRSFPDDVPQAGEDDIKRFMAVKIKNSDDMSDPAVAARAEAGRALAARIGGDPAFMNSFIASLAFPQFYGLSMPLLKYGLPVRPIQLDNVRRFTGYLRDIRFAILSYEYMKPVSPDIDTTISEWVRAGGTLIYVGDGSDPFHGIRSWWRESGYDHPAQHLFETLGLERDPKDGAYSYGQGRVVVVNDTPARFCLTKAASDQWRETVRAALKAANVDWAYRNDITLRRGPYVISEVMDESCSGDEKVFEGLYADLMADGYPVIRKKVVRPDEGAILADLSAYRRGEFSVIATAARVFDAKVEEDKLTLRVKAADKVLTTIRVMTPFGLGAVTAVDEDGAKVDVACEMDGDSGTALFTYRSADRAVTIAAKKA